MYLSGSANSGPSGVAPRELASRPQRTRGFFVGRVNLNVSDCDVLGRASQLSVSHYLAGSLNCFSMEEDLGKGVDFSGRFKHM